jgi:WD40 repeat protein
MIQCLVFPAAAAAAAAAAATGHYPVLWLTNFLLLYWLHAAGVMALHFHPEFANLLAVGCYDGTVMVFDVRRASDKPICQASVKTKKHADPVWQVCWQVGVQAAREPARCLMYLSPYLFL